MPKIMRKHFNFKSLCYIKCTSFKNNSLSSECTRILFILVHLKFIKSYKRNSFLLVKFDTHENLCPTHVKKSFSSQSDSWIITAPNKDYNESIN